MLITMSVAAVLALSVILYIIAVRAPKGGLTPQSILDEIIIEEATAFAVPIAIVRAIVAVESGGDAQAVGAAGEIGLMQIKLSTAQQMGYKGPGVGLFDVRTNIHYGTKYLAWQLNRYRSLPSAIAAYNAGSVFMVGNKFKNQAYVDKVMSYAGMVA